MKKLFLIVMTGLVIVGLSSCEDDQHKKHKKHPQRERHERRW